MNRSSRVALGLLIATSTIFAIPVEASAQGLFGLLFGGRPSYRAPPPVAARAYADPGSPSDPLGLFGPPQAAPAPSGGRGVAFCVRLCDGRYFPVQGVGSTQLCSAMCPAAETMTFYGGSIDYAAASDGSRYADLDNAFVYRQRLVPGCTCNGKDAFGLATVDLAKDPTLREGDIVATANGLMAFQMSRSRRGEVANFTPVDVSRLSRELRERLANTKIAGPVQTPGSAQADSETSSAARKLR
jgi:hypothetical protein